MEYKINILCIPKQNNFSLLRILCCFIVIYEHAVLLSGSSWLNLGLRSCAVNVFFIISGFWVTFSFLRSESVIDYALKRIKKIFPLYWSVVIGFALLFAFVSTLSVREYFTDIGFWKYLAANILTLNFIHPNLPGVFNGAPINGSLWTIKIEIGFYIILPFIIRICLSSKNSYHTRNNCLIILTIIYMLSAMYGLLINKFIKKYSLPSSIANQLPSYISYFVIGMTTFFYLEKIILLLNKLIIVAFPLLIICLKLQIIYVSVFIEPIALCIVIMWFALKVEFLFKFSKIHDYSYLLYLIHYPIIMLILNFVSN